jgi:primosomal protein N' (replication factor Y)
MNSFARIAVNIPSVTGVFDYRLPPELEGKIGAGHLVTVPFGRQTAQGVVLELISQPSVAETKPILDLLDPLPVLTGCQIELAKQMAVSTLNPLAAIIELMLPSGLGQQADVLYTLHNPQSEFRYQQSTETQ